MSFRVIVISIAHLQSWQRKVRDMGQITTFNLHGLRRKYNLESFVETGTQHGNAVVEALKHFRTVYSIEIEEKEFKYCVDKFKKEISDGRVFLYHGDSSIILPEVIKEVRGNALFWLDAHFPGSDSNDLAFNHEKRIETRLPLETEMTAIKNSRLGNDVIITDDLRLYNYDIKYSSGNLSKEWIDENVGDIDTDFMTRLFGGSHDFEEVTTHEGYCILTPKEKQ
jgi:hypothetical protein